MELLPNRWLKMWIKNIKCIIKIKMEIVWMIYQKKEKKNKIEFFKTIRVQFFIKK